MNIKIRATDFDLTTAIESYIDKKISHLGKYFPNMDVLCEVEIGKTTGRQKSGDVFRAEVNIVEPGGSQYFSVAEESDLYAAVDVVRDEAERSIVSRKKKKETLWKRGAGRFKGIIKNFYHRK